MPWRWALDLVTTVSSLRGRERASSKAKRMMRSTPARVNIDTSVAASLGQAAVHAAADAGVLAFGVLAHDHPVELRAGDVAQRAGDAGQDARRPHVGVLVEAAGRSASRRPHSVMWSGTSGAPAEPNRIASWSVISVEAVRRHHRAVLLVVVAEPQSKWSNVEREAAVALGAAPRAPRGRRRSLPCRCRRRGWRRSRRSSCQELSIDAEAASDKT